VPETGHPDNAVAPTPEALAQAPPKGPVRSYDEMNTGQMVFELQGSVHELKALITTLSQTVGQVVSRTDSLEKTGSEIKEILRSLAPRLEELAGFTKHRAPYLADKTDLANLSAGLKAEIEKRPTRRQSVTDVILIAGLVGTLLTIGSRIAH